MNRKVLAHVLLIVPLYTNVRARAAPQPRVPMLTLPSSTRPDNAELDPDAPAVEPHGYVQLHTSHDSRQTAGLWAAGFVLAPLPYAPDANGCDINTTGQFTMAHTLSLFGCDSGPFTLGRARISGKCYGLFQGFLGTPATGLSFLEQQTFQLSGAFTISSVYANIAWKHTTLKLGHDFNPLFPIQYPPHVVSGNGGIPFVPAIPNPQVAVTFTAKNNVFARATAYTQLLYSDNSPNGMSIGAPAFAPLSRSGTPALCITLGYNSPQGHVVWVAADARRLLPELALDDHASNNGITCARGAIFGCLHTEKFNLSGQVIGGGNACDLISLGGYAVASHCPPTGLPVCETFRNLRFITLWGNLDFKKKALFSSGVFAGYTRNLGSSKKLYISPSTGQPFVYEYPIAPGWHALDITRASIYSRCTWGPVEIGLECEWTRARYAIKLNEYALPAHIKNNCSAVTNVHLELATTCTF